MPPRLLLTAGERVFSASYRQSFRPLFSYEPKCPICHPVNFNPKMEKPSYEVC